MKIYQYKSEKEKLRDVVDTVKTIEKVAASQIHFLKGRVLYLDNYVFELTAMLKRLLLLESNLTHPLLTKRASGPRAVIFVTGDKGLVGDLYHKMLASFIENKNRYSISIVLGKKGANFFKELSIETQEFPFEFSDIPEPEEANAAAEFLFEKFLKSNIASFEILYPSFISLLEQEPKYTPFLPFDFQDSQQVVGNSEFIGYPIIEPSGKEVFSWLIKNYIELYFYKILSEAKLSELSARTLNSEHASAKARDLIKKGDFLYLKQRRISITEKQLESFIGHKEQ